MSTRLIAASMALLVIVASLALILLSASVTVRGVITDALTGEPLVAARIANGNVAVWSDEEGRFVLPRVARRTAITADLEGYHSTVVPLPHSYLRHEQAFNLSLQPVVVEGTVLDAQSGRALAGAVVSVGEQTMVTGDDGVYRLLRVKVGADIRVWKDGYEEAVASYTRDSSLPIWLKPNTVVVTVVGDDVPSVGHAILSLNGNTVESDGANRFVLRGVRQGALLAAQADGYLPASAPYTGGDTIILTLTPNTVVGLLQDQVSGLPVTTGITVTLKQATNTRMTTGNASGHFEFRRVFYGAVLTAHGAEYETAVLTYTGQTSLTFLLRPDSLRGVVRDRQSGLPLSGVTVLLEHGNDVRTTRSDDNGHFMFLHAPMGARLSVSPDGYEPVVITHTGQLTVDVVLRPDTLRGVVRDAYTGQPMPGITVTVQQGGIGRSLATGERGQFEFLHVPLAAIVSAAAPGYAQTVVTYTGQVTVDMLLRPNVVRGIVRDGKTGQPLVGAAVSVGSVSSKTNERGEYVLTGIPEGQPLVVSAANYDQTRVTIGPVTRIDVRLQTFSVRGIYVPFYLLTAPERVRALIEFAHGAGMNAIVVDVKGDDGYLAYESNLPLAKEVKARWPGPMMSLDDVLKLAKSRGMYTIARITVFKDNVLALARPDLSVRDRQTDAPWDDCGNGSTYWADPFRKEIIEYNAGIAEETARMGFDEIQFDYIRFPPACVGGGRLASATYAVTPTMQTRIEAVEAFLKEARRRLQPLGVALAVDTFGWTLVRDDDLNIGQRMENIAKYVDYICPMVYPSTWEPGALGLDYAPAHPYELVYKSLSYGINRLKGIPGVKVRPWLQDFDDYQFKGLPYGVKELNEQRRAAADAGAEGWMLWNAGGSYSEEQGGR